MSSIIYILITFAIKDLKSIMQYNLIKKLVKSWFEILFLVLIKKMEI